MFDHIYTTYDHTNQLRLIYWSKCFVKRQCNLGFVFRGVYNSCVTHWIHNVVTLSSIKRVYLVVCTYSSSMVTWCQPRILVWKWPKICDFCQFYKFSPFPGWKIWLTLFCKIYTSLKSTSIELRFDVKCWNIQLV